MSGGGPGDIHLTLACLVIPLIIIPAIAVAGIASLPKRPVVCEDRIITQGSCSDYPESRGSELVVNLGVATCRCKK